MFLMYLKYIFSFNTSKNKNMFNIIIKTIIIYFFAMFAMRLMGKRQAGKLQPFDLIIAIIIAEVASTPMDGAGIPITYGIVPIITLLILHNLIALIALKSDSIRGFLDGKPSIVIRKGIIDAQLLAKLNYNLNDLFEQLREKDVMSISDVYYAVLETNGELSIMLKPEKRPIQPEDMNIKPENPGFCYDIVIDGKLKPKNLQKLGLSKNTVLDSLAKKNRKVENTFIATCDESGNLFLQDYNGKQTNGSIKNG